MVYLQSGSRYKAAPKELTNKYQRMTYRQMEAHDDKVWHEVLIVFESIIGLAALAVFIILQCM